MFEAEKRAAPFKEKTAPELTATPSTQAFRTPSLGKGAGGARRVAYDRDVVQAALHKGEVESLFKAHIGLWVERPLCRAYGEELRFGTKGGFVVKTQTGQWYDHVAGRGGDLFHYVSQSRGISYGQAIEAVDHRLPIERKAEA